MGVTVVDRDFGYNELVESLADLDDSDGLAVLVGFLATEAGDDLITYAAANEFGTDVIPERSFLRSTVDLHRADYEKELADAVGLMIDSVSKGGVFSGGGRAAIAQAKKALQRLGLRAVGDVQAQIVEIRDPPNAPSTIARKGSSNPLIDTGRMRQSVSFVVVDGTEVIG